MHDHSPGNSGVNARIAISDQKLNRLFVSCHNKKMLVVDAGTGKIIDALPIGGFSDATIFDPGTNLAFSSNSDGTLDIIAASGPNRLNGFSR